MADGPTREDLAAFYQAEQAECLGVVRESKMLGMTRRLRRLEPLDPEAVHRAVS